ncbi:Golgi resident protein GCP60 isoform X2 [Bacillus rossius redtenbacheri]|uniref:Golgi resident protein GCP60 isoform X2 n=1 Tax=Bacillus rossius redtenbacheri TaxID=93214 RepID=UPI002FDE77B9
MQVPSYVSCTQKITYTNHKIVNKVCLLFQESEVELSKIAMASESEPSQLDSQFDQLSIASEESCSRSHIEDDTTKDSREPFDEWGFCLADLYRLALRFYKEKEGKAVHLSYEDKLRLVAFTRQVNHGAFEQNNLPPLGVLDVIGRDRRLAWQALGDISPQDAMVGFVELLDKTCPMFRPYVEAHKRDDEERERLAQEELERQKEEEERIRLEEEAKEKEERDRAKQEAQRRQIQDALNQQTYHQFKAYAEQQYPGNPEQQGVLIRQLQEQHYHQYMQQLCQQQCRQHGSSAEPDPGEPLANGTLADGTDGADGDSEDEASQASMWTRKDIREFKESIRKEGGDAVIKVGHGETVTVRVPTHEDGTCLFWEFATDSYDIGFGVYFEWSKSPTNQVSVHISESEDEEDVEDEEDEELAGEDVERGGKPGDLASRPPLSVIVPVYRRDCQDEVYAGSHLYPGQGVYLLKFDNSYSLWRSKTLYYRVYYTR